MEANGGKGAVQKPANFSIPAWAEEFGSRLFRETHHPAGQLAQMLTAIRLEKRTGRLEINFSQGSPNGALIFTETEKE